MRPALATTLAWALAGLLLGAPNSRAVEAVVSGEVGANFRNGPGKDNLAIGHLEPGEVVEVISTSGRWSRVERRDSSTGWIWSGLLSTRDAGSTAGSLTSEQGTDAAAVPTSPPGDGHGSETAASGEASPAATPPPPESETTQLLSTIAELRTAVRSLERRIEDGPGAAPPLPLRTPDVIAEYRAVSELGPRLGIGAAGFVIGALVGSAMARSRRDSYRNRLRF